MGRMGRRKRGRGERRRRKNKRFWREKRGSYRKRGGWKVGEKISLAAFFKRNSVYFFAFKMV